MIKMALVTGVIIAAGYWYLMSAMMGIAMNQINNYQQQYDQAIALTDQLASSDYETNR
jgi:hypothetical protein